MSWGFGSGCGVRVRLVAGVVVGVFGGLGLGAGPAFAVAPETPVVLAPAEVRAGSAVLRGVLDPGKTGAPGTFELLEYQYLYRASATECAGGSVAPEPAGLSLGGGSEEVPQAVGELAGGTEYTVCLRVKGAGGEAVSTPVTFKTAITPEAPVTSSATGITTTSAVLGGVLNPGAASEAGSWEVLYNTGESECQNGSKAPEPPGTALGGKEEPVSTTVTGLAPQTTYTFCLLARNSAGEEALGAPVMFTTGPPVVTEEAVSGIEANTATVEALVTPQGGETTYKVQYGTSESYGQSVEGSTPARLADSAHPVSVSVQITGLTPGTSYHYRLLASNTSAPAGVPGPDKTMTTLEAPSATADSCPNAARRAEQPGGSSLPDCRAYEMVSPTETDGQDATDAKIGAGPRAAPSGEAIAYASRGAFGNPTGANLENELVSRREPNGWSTQNITPLFNPQQTETESAYQALAFTPELTEGLAGTSAALTSEAPTVGMDEDDLYVADFTTSAYRYVGTTHAPLGASTDLSRVVFGEEGEVFEWISGSTVPVSVSNEAQPLNASIGDAASVDANGPDREKDVWHAVSGDGSRVYFTSPAFAAPHSAPIEDGRQLYVRVNSQQPQSPLVSPEANGTGTLTEGSDSVSSLVTATAFVGKASAGSTEFDVETTTVGHFIVGQEIVPGSAFEPGTTVTKFASGIVTVSKPSVALLAGGSEISAQGPAPFVAGQSISGNGISPGTTVTAVVAGSLTLSSPALLSGGPVELRAGGGCTVPADACTVNVSASERFAHENPQGIRSARYWGANVDGSRVFFTSDAELTEDAHTSPTAANLYEYDLEKPEGERLIDLTVDETDAEGAAVQGVAQISEDGSYVYFVAKGALAAGASEQQCRAETKGERNGEEPKQDNLGCNLYVVHDGGVPRFVATLAWNDRYDWTSKEAETKPGPGYTTAVVSPGGGHLAFISEQSLTGYDNRQAQPGECEGEIVETGGLESGSGNCREVFVFDAVTGGLVCASCDPSGARPVGPSGLMPVPPHPFVEYRPRQVLEDGTVFFDSGDALVADAAGGQENVYEYEGGRVFAISDVAGGHEAFFMDASADGSDVFFATSDDLVPQDTSANVVVYDARVNGGFQAPSTPPACTSNDKCLSPSSPQPGVFGLPASATFSGPGNVTPPVAPTKVVVGPESRAQMLVKALRVCRKKRVKRKRLVCERVARARFGPVKAKKSAKRSGGKAGVGSVGGERGAGR